MIKSSVFTAKAIYQPIIRTIDLVCNQNGVDPTHGLPHAIKIATQTEKALFSEKNMNVDSEQYEDIICAALLHDVDDRKFFNSKDCSNARLALKNAQISEQRINAIVLMIELVSFAKNGNSIEEKYPVNYYLPRYVDRSQAIGIQGLHRSYEYNLARRFDHIFDKETPRPQNREELYEMSKGRDLEYMKTGHSRTVVDHFFDKLVHIRLPAVITNPYLNDLYQQKHDEMVDFILLHAKTGYENYKKDLIYQYEINGKHWQNLE